MGVLGSYKKWGSWFVMISLLLSLPFILAHVPATHKNGVAATQIYGVEAVRGGSAKHSSVAGAGVAGVGAPRDQVRVGAGEDLLAAVQKAADGCDSVLLTGGSEVVCSSGVHKWNGQLSVFRKLRLKSETMRKTDTVLCGRWTLNPGGHGSIKRVTCTASSEVMTIEGGRWRLKNCSLISVPVVDAAPASVVCLMGGDVSMSDCHVTASVDVQHLGSKRMCSAPKSRGKSQLPHKPDQEPAKNTINAGSSSDTQTSIAGSPVSFATGVLVERGGRLRVVGGSFGGMGVGLQCHGRGRMVVKKAVFQDVGVGVCMEAGSLVDVADTDFSCSTAALHFNVAPTQSPKHTTPLCWTHLSAAGEVLHHAPIFVRGLVFDVLTTPCGGGVSGGALRLEGNLFRCSMWGGGGRPFVLIEGHSIVYPNCV